MKKTVIIVILILSAVMIAVFYALNTLNLSESVKKLKSQLYKNASYEMFYGEWEVTDHIYVDPTPLRGIHYSENEVEEQKASILKGIITKTIQFTDENIVINGKEITENIIYKYYI